MYYTSTLGGFAEKEGEGGDGTEAERLIVLL